MPEYVLAILRLVGWAAYVVGVFWLSRMAANHCGRKRAQPAGKFLISVTPASKR
jgi:hypothetical protein